MSRSEASRHSKVGVVYVYMKDLTEVDLGTLETIVSRSYSTLTAGTYPKRAREGGNS